MPFKKGEEWNGNKYGRPVNAHSHEIREQITHFCKENLLYFLEEMKAMRKGHAKAQAFLTLLLFVLAKKSELKIDINKLTTEELNLILEKIKTDENL